MDMKLKTFSYFLKEALMSLRRNSWIGLASIGTVAVSLIIVGVSLLLVVNTNLLTRKLESNVQITAFVREDVELREARNLEDRIVSVDGIEEVRFVSKEVSLELFRKQLGKQSRMVEALGGNNPLPHSYQISVKDPKQVKAVALKIEKIDGIEKVNYGQGVVERLFAFTKWTRLIGVALMLLLGLAAIFLIATTIRLTVFARRKEIQIMKMIGATDWFIRWPFLMEGMMLGFVGALLAVCIVGASYLSFVSYLQRDLAFIGLRADSDFLLIMSLILTGVGMFIGAVGSGISMRKFLKV